MELGGLSDLMNMIIKNFRNVVYVDQGVSDFCRSNNHCSRKSVTHNIVLSATALARDNTARNAKLLILPVAD
jgi:hypothetical protein